MRQTGHPCRPQRGMALRALALLAALALAPGRSGAQALETGVASWYGPNFHGKRTANGEVYDKERLSCAHKTMAFGTYLRVLNLDNGSSVVVRVNDRGPFAKNRVVDLSEAAARIIGMIASGTARVSLTPIPKEEALAWKGGGIGGAAPPDGGSAADLAAGGGSAGPAGRAGVPAAKDARVHIQVASYASEANAKATLERLDLSGLHAVIERAGSRFRVVFPDLSPDQSRRVTVKLDGLGYRGYTVTTITPAR